MEEKKDNRLKCSFCGKSQDQVKKLIAGPGVFICDECVDLCNEILDDEIFEANPAEQPTEQKSKLVASHHMTGQIDQMGAACLLQALSASELTCLVTVEDRNSVFVLTFAQGRPNRARLDQLKGYDAVIEFLVSWTKGNFSVRDANAESLDESCGVGHSLESILLDAAKKMGS